MYKEAYEHTRFFAEECGKRIAGTDALMKASDYIVDFYKQKGIEVETHDFEVPVCSIKHSSLKANFGGTWKELNHTAALFSKETPAGGLTLPLVYAENGSIANLKEKDVKGKAVLICRDVYMVYPDIWMYKRLAQFGAAAVIYTTGDGHKDVPYVYANYETMEEDFTIPTAVVHYDTALELVNSGVEEIFYEAQFEVTMGKTRNTAGVIPGCGKEDETIFVCAHLDSAMGSVGATDDVAGVGMIMELAAYYHQQALKGKKPERTIRFMAWSGHECGLHGSKYYLLNHKEVFEKTRFVLNYDVVGNALSNYSMWTGGSDEIEKQLNDITASLELDWPVNMGPMVVDTLSFAAKQIPHLTLTAGAYGGNHTVYDNMDLISEEGFIMPVRFSKAVIDWAAWTKTISQGYPAQMDEAMRATADMYGWGLFDKC
ncbi:M28 family peptidase [Anaerovorax odorimutans]|nr:M28 family peptidase [Anaerovorax odorimutans]